MNRIPLVAFVLSSAFAAFAGGDGSLSKPDWRAEILVPGVTLYRADVDDPRSVRLNAVKIDLKAPGIGFTGTGKCPGYGQPLEEAPSLYVKGKKVEPCVKRTALETTQAFFERCARPAENGGRGFDMLVAFGAAQGDPPHSKGYACPAGLVISDGVVVSDVSRGKAATLIVRKDGSADIVEKLSPNEYASLAFARSGYRLIRKAGADVSAQEGSRRGRLAAGLTADRRYLYVVTADTGDLARAASDGVDYHDLNAIFESFGVTDAAAFSFGRQCELVVMDRKNAGGRVLNGYDAPSVAVQANVGIYRVDAKKEAEKQREANPVEAKFVSTPRLNSSTVGKTRVLKGQVKIGYTSEMPRFKRPLVNVVALFDVNGMWRYYDVMCLEPNSSRGGMLRKIHTVDRVSGWQPEVDAATWKTVTIGSPKSAFFTGYGIPEKAKLMLYRIEVWEAGKTIADFDGGDVRAAKKLNVPDDWYVKGKYPGKIVYVYPPEEKK